MTTTLTQRNKRQEAIAARAYANYVNGNLADAKHIARGVSYPALLKWLDDKRVPACHEIAAYLKNLGTFADACKAERQHKDNS